MNICTICTGNQPWLTHLERWCRHACISNPQANLCLIYAGDERLIPGSIIEQFDDVKVYDPSVIERPWFNEVRMDATELFGVDDMLYVDCDCDIHEDLSGVADETDKELGYCLSPWAHKTWIVLSDELGFGYGKWSANNGLLWMKRSFKEEYAEARAKIEEIQKPSRIGGILVFNTLLRMHPLLGAELPYDYSVIWHDFRVTRDNTPHLRNAKTIQYCNDDGQRKRLHLEQIWRNSL